jgi:putative Flp pilus-assembly TadE/G-like protein
MIYESGRRKDRGAITIQVAFALVALIVFTSMVIDYGVLWVSRREAQNAADAAALGGALAYAQSGSVPLSALHYASINQIWGEGNSAANVRIDQSGISPFPIPPCGTNPGCVRVDIFRNTVDRPERSSAILGNPLPTYFASMVGIPNQGIRATATAWAGAGTTVQCMVPWAVMDRWADNYDDNKDPTYFTSDPLPGVDGWSPNDAYQPDASFGAPPSSGWKNVCATKPCDVYIPPYDQNPNHTGWKVIQDYGRQLILKAGTVGNYSDGWANIINLPGTGGGADYNHDIKYCNPTPVSVAKASQVCPAANTPDMEKVGCINVETGLKVGPTEQGVSTDANNIISTDPLAHWDPSATGPNGLSGAVVDGNGAVDMDSQRIRPLAVIDIDYYIANIPNCSGSNCVAKIANIIGYFVEGMCNDVKAANGLAPGMSCSKNDVVGRIVTIPGQYVSGVGTTPANAAFIYVIQLVR